jgi:hypothetical protein
MRESPMIDQTLEACSGAESSTIASRREGRLRVAFGRRIY